MGRSPAWAGGGIVALVASAATLTRVNPPPAGRAYAAYGGVYIVAAVAWLWAVEGVGPDRWDVAGAIISLIGSALILFGPRER